MSTEKKNQIIYVLNRAGHCGVWFTWALHNALGYNYYTADWLGYEYNLNGNPDGNYNLGEKLRMISYFLSEAGQHGLYNIKNHTHNATEDILINNSDDTMANNELVEWAFVIRVVNQILKEDKILFSKKNSTIVIQNEFRYNLPIQSNDPNNLVFYTNGDSYFSRTGVWRKGLESINEDLEIQPEEPQVFDPLTGACHDSFPSNFRWENILSKYSIIINLEDMIFNKNYDFVKYIYEDVDIDVLHSSMLQWHNRMLEVHKGNEYS